MFNPIRIISGIIIPLVVLGFVGHRLLSTDKQVHKAFDDVNRSPDPNAPSGGNDEHSLLHANNLASALNKVKAKVGDDGQLLDLTIYPTYLVAQASTGKQDSGQAYKVQDDGKVIPIPLKLYGPGKLSDNVFPLAKVDTSLPERLTDAVARKKPGTTLDNVSYLHLDIDVVSGKPEWSIYLKTGGYYTADFDGSNVSAPGDTAAKAGAAASKAAADAIRQATGASKAGSAGASVGGKSGGDPAASAQAAANAALDSAHKRIACIQAAAGDAVKMAACSQ
jgi:hypothetical protein